MKNSAIALAFTIVFSGNLWASAHVSRPAFESINAEGQVAIGDTKIDDDEEVAPFTVTSESSSEAQKITPAPETPGFAVRVISTRAYHKRTRFSGPLVGTSGVEPNYTIQLSSFLTEKEAQATFVEFQKKKSFPVWTATALVGGKTRYRIYYGHFKNLAQAAAAKARVISESGVKEAFVQKVFGKLTAQND